MKEAEDMPTNYNDEPVANADRFYKNEDGTPDFTREIPTGMPAGVSLHEAALTRPHMVEKIIAEGGPQAQIDAAQKSNQDNERALSTIIPDMTKTPEVLADVDAAAVINNSTDEIQPNRDVNPEAHKDSAQTGTETLSEEKAAPDDEAAAEAKSQVAPGETAPLKVEVTEPTAEQKEAEKTETAAQKKSAAAKKGAATRKAAAKKTANK